MKIPVFMLLADITNNAVQFRNAQDDLPLLMQGNLCAYGWNIGFSLGIMARARITWFLLKLFSPTFIQPTFGATMLLSLG
jgi:hypothetical protein